MSERVLRGSRLGTSSYEDDREVSPAPRQRVAYQCTQGHQFELPFSTEAEIPDVWECTRCGAEAVRVDGDGPANKHLKPPRTHWDMLLERRSRDELEELLSERLEMLRSGQIGPVHLHRDKATDNKSGRQSRSA